jgi:hypothetical protein
MQVCHIATRLHVNDNHSQANERHAARDHDLLQIVCSYKRNACQRNKSTIMAFQEMPRQDRYHAELKDLYVFIPMCYSSQRRRS